MTQRRYAMDYAVILFADHNFFMDLCDTILLFFSHVVLEVLSVKDNSVCNSNSESVWMVGYQQ